MDLRWPLRIVEERQGDVVILIMTGRLGAASARLVAETLAGVIERGQPRVVVDLAGVDYLSSAGLAVIETAAGDCQRARGALVLCHLTEPVRIALDLGGLLPHVHTESSREDAIARAAS